MNTPKRPHPCGGYPPAAQKPDGGYAADRRAMHKNRRLCSSAAGDSGNPALRQRIIHSVHTLWITSLWTGGFRHFPGLADRNAWLCTACPQMRRFWRGAFWRCIRLHKRAKMGRRKQVGVRTGSFGGERTVATNSHAENSLKDVMGRVRLRARRPPAARG